MLQSIKQKVKYRETTVIIFSTRFVFKSQNNTMNTAGASILMSSGWCFILFDFGWKQHKKGIKKIHETSTCLQFNSSLKSVHIQDHLNHIYHHGATCSSLFTQQLKHLLFLKKRGKNSHAESKQGPSPGARRHVNQGVILLSLPSVSSTAPAILVSHSPYLNLNLNRSRCRCHACWFNVN